MHEISKKRLGLAGLFILLSTLVSSHGCRQGFVSWLVRDVTLDTAHFSGGAHFGQKSISLDPGGVDVIRWSATTNPTQAGDIGMNVTSGQLQTFDNGAVKAIGTQSAAFGDGSDGNVTLSVNGTLARDFFYNNLTLNANVAENSGEYRIYVAGTLTLNSGSSISCTILGPGTLPNGQSGGAGGNGAAGTTPAAQAATCVFAQSGPFGQGGAGAAGGANAGGAGGSANANTGATGAVRAAPGVFLGYSVGLSGSTPTLFQACGGTGGGGGGGSAAGTIGGTGGNGGGVCVIAANKITGSGSINANATNGGNASGAANGGGGGGGGGGVVYLLYGDKSGWTGTCTATGGSGGSGVGTGTTGTAGNNGSCIQIQE